MESPAFSLTNSRLAPPRQRSVRGTQPQASHHRRCHRSTRPGAVGRSERFEDNRRRRRQIEVCGHTHMPFIRLVDRRLVINSGSIGMPYGRSAASWVLLNDGQASLRHTAVDVDAAIAAVVADSSYPDRREWAEYYLRVSASDTEALAVFAPRDGRRTE
ncbi:MAG: metallophosphoesterase family protein [Nakamurella sp.]